MYQSFEAIVSKGKIKPLEKIKLKEATRVLVTIVDKDVESEINWKKLEKWVAKQKKEKKFTSYPSAEAAKQHLRRLMKA